MGTTGNSNADEPSLFLRPRVSLLRVCHASKSSLVSTCFSLHDRSRYSFSKYQDAVSPQWRCQRPTTFGMPKTSGPGALTISTVPSTSGRIVVNLDRCDCATRRPHGFGHLLRVPEVTKHLAPPPPIPLKRLIALAMSSSCTKSCLVSQHYFRFTSPAHTFSPLSNPTLGEHGHSVQAGLTAAVATNVDRSSQRASPAR